MTELQVNAQDVIRLIEQYFIENNLTKSLQALQEETGVSLNTVDNVEQFMSDIHQGNWDNVLRVAQRLTVGTDKLIMLYEQIVIELIELRETDVARLILRETPAMDALKHKDATRYMKLDGMCSKPFFDAREAYPEGGTKEKRRQHIARTLANEVNVVAPARLLALLSDALKFQQLDGRLPAGEEYDLFRGQAPQKVDTMEKPPTDILARIRFEGRNHAETLAFSPSGKHLATGSMDGLIEIWDPETGRLRKELPFQKEGNFMAHAQAVLSLAWSRDSEYLCSGSADGELKVWKSGTGQCARKISKAHTEAVTCCAFSADSMQIISGGYDNMVRIHGLKSGRVLKEFRRHTGSVQSVCFLAGVKDRALSCSADGSAIIWDCKTMHPISVIKPPNPNPTKDLPLRMALQLREEKLVVCPKSSSVYLYTIQGTMSQVMNSGKREGGGDFVTATASPRGEYVYCVGEDRILYCFSTEDGKLQHTLALDEGSGARDSERTITAIGHHPHRNLIATSNAGGLITIWGAK